MNEIILVALFLIYSVIREYFYQKQMSSPRPQMPTPPRAVEHQDNTIMKEDKNEIAIDDPEFDIRKINKVIIDGQERDIQIK